MLSISAGIEEGEFVLAESKSCAGTSRMLGASLVVSFTAAAGGASAEVIVAPGSEVSETNAREDFDSSSVPCGKREKGNDVQQMSR